MSGPRPDPLAPSAALAAAAAVDRAATDRAADYLLDTQYALAKQVPSMRGGASVHTNYGPILLTAPEATKVADVIERALEARLKRLERASAVKS